MLRSWVCHFTLRVNFSTQVYWVPANLILGILTGDGLGSNPGGSRNVPSCSMLQKPHRYFSTAHAQSSGSGDLQAHRRHHAEHQKFSDASTGPQDLNIYNVHVFKMEDKNKVSGHIAQNSVAVTMQGPGTVSLSTTPQVVGPGDSKPDHTISMAKDAGECKGPECSMLNVKSGKHKYDSRRALM